MPYEYSHQLIHLSVHLPDRDGCTLSLSAPKRKDQMECGACLEVVIVGGLVVGPVVWCHVVSKHFILRLCPSPPCQFARPSCLCPQLVLVPPCL